MGRIDGYVVFAFVSIFAGFAVDFISKMRRGLLDVGRNVSTDADIIDRLTSRVRDVGLGKLLRGVTIYPSDCSFCENRSRVYLKLRNDSGSFYDSRTLLYVFVHELAHVATSDDEGEYHGPSFTRTFKRLLAMFPEINTTTTAPEDYTQGCTM